jgi:hypothetical protein
MIPMTQIKFRDGQQMPWPVYRAMMNGEISPFKAVAEMRREPAGAIDAAMPRRSTRDQTSGGNLTPEFYRATLSYLA